LVITNADIQGETNGIQGPSHANGETLIENSYFSDVTDVSDDPTGTVSGAIYLPKSLVLQNDSFAAPSGFSLNAIDMLFLPNGGITGNMQINLTSPDQVFVYNYDQVSSDNFQVYYTQQTASSIMLQTGYYYGLIASPVSGLTNQQNWNTYGIATAGAVAPSNATTMTGIDGLVVTISGPPQVVVAGSGGSATSTADLVVAGLGDEVATTAASPSTSTQLIGSASTGGHETAPTRVSIDASTPPLTGSDSVVGSLDPQTTAVAAAQATALTPTKQPQNGTRTTARVVSGPLAVSLPRRSQAAQTRGKTPVSTQWTPWNV
jgi:hypothetical protein